MPVHWLSEDATPARMLPLADPNLMEEEEEDEDGKAAPKKKGKKRRREQK